MAGFGSIHESPVWKLQLRARTQEDLVAITEMVADEARVGCPVDHGELVASIHTDFEPGEGYVIVGTDHWAPTEYGSRDHDIHAHPRLVSRSGTTATYRRGMLRFFWPKAGKTVFFRSVRHPGTPAQPFMRPALYRHRVPE